MASGNASHYFALRVPDKHVLVHRHGILTNAFAYNSMTFADRLNSTQRAVPLMNASSIFGFVAGVMATLAALLLVRPLLGKRLESFQQRPGLARWWWAGGLVAVGAALSLYYYAGSPSVVATTHADASVSDSAQPGSMDSVIAALEARLRSKGGSDAEWELLAQSYEFTQRAEAAALARKHKLAANIAGAANSAAAPSKPLTTAGQKLLTTAEAARRKRDYKSAREAYQKLAGLDQMDADAWANYADASASLNGNSLIGDPEQYLRQALRLDPNHQKALWLQASVEHEVGRFQAAVATWQRLLTQMPAGSSDAKLIAANLAEDKLLATRGAAALADIGVKANVGTTSGTGVSAGTVLRGEINLSDALRTRVKPGMTLFILAKSVDSPGAPVAVMRTTTGNWPVQFQLDDSMAMLPGRNLSGAGKVTVEARISLSGLAASAPGDLLGVTPAMSARGAAPLRIVIQKVIG
jgi:cytochrome c-type biogenesis protein CcmH/NrfG